MSVPGARWGVVLAVLAVALAPAPALLAQGPAPQGEVAEA